jgi:lysyl-tRNA synthetase class 1
VGKGITVDRWLRYASQESLALFLFRNPRKARRLSWEVIPRMMDEHLGLLDTWYAAESPDKRPAELRFVDPRLPAQHPYPHGVSFAMLLNLVATIGTDDADLVMRYVDDYRGAQPGGQAFLRGTVEWAIRYHREVLLPAVTPPSFDDDERTVLAQIAAFLAQPHDEDEIQTMAFQTARDHGLEPKRAFRALYRALSGQDHGPRFGPFVKLVGQEAARSALQRAVDAAH